MLTLLLVAILLELSYTITISVGSIISLSFPSTFKSIKYSPGVPVYVAFLEIIDSSYSCGPSGLIIPPVPSSCTTSAKTSSLKLDKSPNDATMLTNKINTNSPKLFVKFLSSKIILSFYLYIYINNLLIFVVTVFSYKIR